MERGVTVRCMVRAWCVRRRRRRRRGLVGSKTDAMPHEEAAHEGPW